VLTIITDREDGAFAGRRGSSAIVSWLSLRGKVIRDIHISITFVDTAVAEHVFGVLGCT